MIMNRLFRRWEIKKLHIMRFRIPKMNARKNVIQESHKILLAKIIKCKKIIKNSTGMYNIFMVL
ncbi:MAG TPA: hypothetical protein DEF39_12750 [Hungateiclostridium thermocellum]|uniref:Uncharacterized protein n=1 Tax=Acetivibrio thermocellus AD2 TaxID=1138384 RepID=A0AB36TE08_ACETH|nr:hypothetical protein Clo1313_0882 [Acetivibrio thermocellus DSM 1313]ALX07888.1 hypothetical protein AD2_00893 [Acetivibrio thermocellus AD2]ANV75634.1 hypothetical protein LQRI_0893 [Acetivibrio thermocellus DSM 2360]EIC03255.1 hypothetical protein YSBL_0212 [Acetivibrio thermocellus YS]NLU28086.1 hypothetical protein [Acetivibrio thermocellus]CDG36045.1 hypothetical protein CTHBC1_1402 [Acetivibrio thermocellus BC1]